jgi:hypothetical protein
MVCGHTTVLTAPYSSTLQHWMILSQEHFWCIVYLQATVSTSSMWRRQHVLVIGTLLQQALWIPIQYASVLLRAGGQSIHGRKSQHVHAGWKCCLHHAGDEWQQWGRETVTVCHVTSPQLCSSWFTIRPCREFCGCVLQVDQVSKWGTSVSPSVWQLC